MKKIIVSNKASNKFFSLLENLKLDFVKSIDNKNFNLNYLDHPDISVFSFEDKVYVENSVYNFYAENLKGVDVQSVNVETFKNKETVLNIAYNDEYFFHNEKFSDKEIFSKLLKSRKYVKINQGYANCSMICFQNSVITSDEGIYKCLLENKFKVHLVSTNGIFLNGYKNGFIGGTCGFIEKDKLLFYGDVTKYIDYDIIKKIADKEKVKLIFPKDEPFVDLGGIILVGGKYGNYKA